MKTPLKLAIVAALAVTVVAVVTLKQDKGKPAAENNTVAVPAATNAPAENTGEKTAPMAAAKLPRLVDVGAGKCIPCKMMAPILEELKKEYAGRMNVEFIDVWENPDAGKPYGIEMIPTQIFFDAEGKELFRHVGFFAKEDILAKWKELAVDLKGTPIPEASGPTSNEPKS
jgi:thioredoxin 1